MGRYQSAFKILYLLSSIDGEISGEELDVIMSYLKANQGEIDFDHRNIVRSLLFLSREDSLNELKKCAASFKEVTALEDRYCLLDFALNLVAADGRITEGEIRLFNILGNIWEIDIDNYLRDKKL